MGLSSDLISQFVKITKDEDKTKKETTVYGTARIRNGVTYVQIDGSELLTPVAESAGANDGERVTVLIKNHKAILNGNLDSPAARTGDVSYLGDSKLDVSTADNTYATIKQFEAAEADIFDLSAEYAEFANVTADTFEAVNTKIQNLEAKNFDAVYANIDFSNIGKAAMEYFYANSGLIKDVTVGDQTITGELVGVTIKGDLIEGNTIKADKLVIKGDDGLFYKLNTDGLSVIDEGNAFVRANSYPEDNVSNVEWHDDYSATVTTNDADELLAIYFWVEPNKTYIFSYEGETCEVAMYDQDWNEVFRSADNVIKDQIVTGAHHCYFSPPNESGLTSYTFRNVRMIEKEVYDKNKIDGSIIAAKSITATKISVNDLVAFDATIGGFKITDNSIYSGVKESIDNTTRGIYMDNDGQVAIGDANNYIKYYRDADGSYKLSISTQSSVKIGGRNLLTGSSDFSGGWECSDAWEEDGVDSNGNIIRKASHMWFGISQWIPMKQGDICVLSANIRGDGVSTFVFYVNEVNENWEDLLEDGAAQVGGFGNVAPTTETRVCSEPYIVQNDCYMRFRIENSEYDSTLWISSMQLERGNTATDWSPAPEDIDDSIEDAAKTATNFMSFDSNGLQVGDKTTGTWSGFRTQITSSAFNILNAAGTVMASYGEKLIELGRNAADSVIRLCGGLGRIEYDVEDAYMQMTADSVRLKGNEMASLYSQGTTNGTSKLGAVHASLAEVQVVAGSGDNNSNLYVKPTQILLYSDDIRVDGTINDNNTGGKFVSVLTGNSGIWTYRKYSDGSVELWGTYWITDQACTTALGSMYRTPAIILDSFPFTVYDPFLTASYETNGYGALLWATTLTTNYDPPNYYLIRPVSGTITLGKINLHVRGRWKS